MDNIFEPILDKDEKVIKIFKPHKGVLFFKSIFLTVLLLLFFYAFILIALIGSSIEQGNNELITSSVLMSLLGFFCVLIGVLIIQILLLIVYYKNIFFGYTNKRIVIRKGIFGVDFKSLDISMIGASTVHVSLIDKILRKDTGTLNFGSMASPMMNSNGGINSFTFSNVTKPYEIYQEIKNYISSNTKIKQKTTKKSKD